MLETALKMSPLTTIGGEGRVPPVTAECAIDDSIASRC
jgi:hypothetical protein